MKRLASHECRVFPAYTSGPAAFYAPRPITVRMRRVTRNAEEASPSSYRPRHLVQLMPKVGAEAATTTVQAPAQPEAEASAFERPIVIALLLTLLPPVGVPLLWASPRYTTAGKAAVTGFITFVLTLATILFVAARR